MNPRPALIAVTGGTGFVGHFVLSELLDRGHHVRALVRPQTQTHFDHPNLTWHRGNIGEDDPALLRDVDILIHIAGVVKAQKREDYFKVNAEMAGTLAHAAEAGSVRRIILISSMAARRPKLSDYAASKRAGEEVVQAAFSGPLAIIRAPAVFGPGDQATAPFFTAIERGILPVPGGRGWKKRKLSLVYVRDLARDIAASAVDGRYDGAITSPSTISELTWPEFAKAASDAAGRRVAPLPIPLSVLYPLAGVTSITSRLFGMGHLTLGKLKEFLYEDWSSETVIPAATPFTRALRETIAAGKTSGRAKEHI